MHAEDIRKAAGLASCLTLGSLLFSNSAAAIDRTYKGFCEASAAVVVGPDEAAVASDDFDAILLFKRGTPIAIGKFAVNDVTDIEAAARIDDRVFWITSHSLNSSGEDKKKRKLLFATKIKASAPMVAEGTVYRNIRSNIAKALQRAEPQLAKDFNIEGMADTPDGHLIIGLRGPLTDDKAILVEIANPIELISGSVAAELQQVASLDLSDGRGTSGRGVRDIARVGTRYLIIGGSEPDGGVPPPKLFWWDGKSDHATPGPQADFSGMTPEAIIDWSEHEAEILSDNGGANIDGVACDDKDPPAGANFPAIDVTF